LAIHPVRKVSAWMAEQTVKGMDSVKLL